MANADISAQSRLTQQSVDLLQTMIRNECVNDGTAESGFESRNASALVSVLEGRGLSVDLYEPVPGRASVIARIEGSDPSAPSLCLMGHTDVVPVTPSEWRHDPFGGEIIDGEIWGRGAVDMLNLTSSMAVAVRQLGDSGFRPRGDLIFFGVADEEADSGAGAVWFAEHERDAIYADYVITETGGLHLGSGDNPQLIVHVGEKGVDWRRITVRGTPGHGSRPFGSDNALVKAAAVVQRLAEYEPAAQFHSLWEQQVKGFGLDSESTAALLDPGSIEEFLRDFPFPAVASHFHACTHTTFSPNVIEPAPEQKTNIIPSVVTVEVDVRTLPGDTAEAVDEHLRIALGPLFEHVEIEATSQYPSTMSPTGTPLWDSIDRAVKRPFPEARIAPHLMVGFTDSQVYRELGAVAYGAGLFSPALDPISFSERFHGNDERIDIDSMALSTQFFIDVARDFLS